MGIDLRISRAALFKSLLNIPTVLNAMIEKLNSGGNRINLTKSA